MTEPRPPYPGPAAPGFDEAGSDLWEAHARWWQDGFTEGADPEYEEQILPLVERHHGGARRVLDVGCGEGQLARRLAARGVEVVGVDPTQGQVEEAVRRGGGPSYVRADAEALPWGSGSFDGGSLDGGGGGGGGGFGLEALAAASA